LFENLKFEIRNLMQSIHKTVLLREAIENLQLKRGMVVVDATLGGGGHSREIIDKIGEAGLRNFQFIISNFQMIRKYRYLRKIIFIWLVAIFQR